MFIMFTGFPLLQREVQEELNSLKSSTQAVVRGFASDMKQMNSLLQLNTSTCLDSLGHYLYSNSHQLHLELTQDQLLLDLVHSAQACVHLTRSV